MSELHWKKTVDGNSTILTVAPDEYGTVQVTTEALAELFEQAGWTPHD